MQTQTIILTAAADPEFGGVGLLLPGMSADEGINPAQEGLLLAHDLLEHVNGVDEIGTIDDELEALGGIWFVRGQFNDIRRPDGSRYYAQRSPHENIAADITRMFRDFFYGSEVDLNPPATEETDEDADFAQIIEFAAGDYESEIDDEVPEGTPTAEQMFTRYADVCLSRMRIGYAKAVAKYDGNGLAANSLFWAVVEAVDKHAKHCEEGQQFELTYGVDKDGHTFARCYEHYPEDDFPEDEDN